MLNFDFILSHQFSFIFQQFQYLFVQFSIILYQLFVKSQLIFYRIYQKFRRNKWISQAIDVVVLIQSFKYIFDFHFFDTVHKSYGNIYKSYSFFSLKFEIVKKSTSIYSVSDIFFSLWIVIVDSRTPLILLSIFRYSQPQLLIIKKIKNKFYICILVLTSLFFSWTTILLIWIHDLSILILSKNHNSNQLLLISKTSNNYWYFFQR